MPVIIRFWLIILGVLLILLADYHTKKILELDLKIQGLDMQKVDNRLLNENITPTLESLNRKLQLLAESHENLVSLLSRTDMSQQLRNLVDLKDGLVANYFCEHRQPKVFEHVERYSHEPLINDLKDVLEVEGQECFFKFDDPKDCVCSSTLGAEISADVGGAISLWVRNAKEGIIFSVSNVAADSFFSILKDKGEKIIIGFYNKDNQYLWSYSFDYSLEDKQWLHMAVVQDGFEVKIYLNGKKAKTPDIATNIYKNLWFSYFTGMGEPRLGCLYVYGLYEQDHYQGEIRDFRYYRKILHPFEVEKLYEDGLKSTSSH